MPNIQQATFSPGPWQVKAKPSVWKTATWDDPKGEGRPTGWAPLKQTAIVPEGQHEAVAMIPEWSLPANANLIAAAPDLYEAAKEILAEFEETVERSEAGIATQLRAAVAKAEGRTP